MSKIIFFLSALISLLFVPISYAYAQKGVDDLPEVAGDYAVEGKKDLRVRVFVHPHKEKDAFKSSPVTLAACTPDVESSATVGLAGWHLPSGATAYRVNYSTVPSSVGTLSAKTAIANVFSTWDNEIVAVSFTEGSQTSVTRAKLDGQNAVFWNRLSSSTLAVTYVWYNTTSQEAVEIDMVYNKRHPWKYTPYTNSACGDLNSYDVQNIGTHEVGHWMGLDDMYGSSDVDVTMYGYGEKGELKKDTLTTGDINAVKVLYP